MSAPASNPFRLPSYREFCDYAVNLAALLLLPLQFCQEWLARLYGYSGLHELRKVYETKGTFGPFAGEEDGSPDAYAEVIQARENRLRVAMRELAAESTRAAVLSPAVKHMGLFLRPKRHRSRARRVLFAVKAFERFGVPLADIPSLIQELRFTTCDYHAATPAVQGKSTDARRADELPYNVEDQYWQMFLSNLPFLYEQLARHGKSEFVSEEWEYEGDCPAVETLVEDSNANTRWLAHVKAQARRFLPAVDASTQLIERVDDKALLAFLASPHKEVAALNSVLKAIPDITQSAREWERDRRAAFLASYRKHSIPVTLIQTEDEFRLLSDPKYEGYRIECTILLRTDFGKYDEESVYCHSFTVNYALVHMASEHHAPFAVGQGNLLVPRKGGTQPNLSVVLQELESTAFEPFAPDLQAYWEGTHPAARYGIVTSRTGPAVALIDISTADGFRVEEWTEDLLTIFKSELAAYGARRRTPVWAGRGLHEGAFVAPAAFFVSRTATLVQPADEMSLTVADRPFVDAVKALREHVPFDTVIVDAVKAETA